MAIPKNAIISNVNITHNIPNFKTESMSLIERTKSRGLHRVEGSFDLIVGNNIKDQKEMTCFLIEAQGSLNPFYLELPRHYASEDLLANPTTPNSYNVGSTTIQLSSFVGEIYKGSCFTIPNDSKLYFIKNTVEGSGNIEIFPALRQNILAGSELEFIQPKIKIRFIEDEQTIVKDNSGFIVRLSVNFVEAL